MRVVEGHSLRTDPFEAIAEATEGWSSLGGEPDIVFAFSSTAQPAEGIAKALAQRYPNAKIAGCTTAGEILTGQHFNKSVVVAGAKTPEIRWATRVAADVRHFDAATAQSLSEGLMADLGVERDGLDPSRHFCLMFVDGLERKEEVIASLMADALEGIPFLGGSAGDDLKFQQTDVISGGKSFPAGAVFVMAETAAPFDVIKHQHYVASPKLLVITRADLPARRVYEMDGYPALDAYARALGLQPSEVTSDVTFMNPLTFVCDGEIYVRSIQRVEDDGSIVFYCGIEEGMVLSIGGHEAMGEVLSRQLRDLEKTRGRCELFLACNCILRALEATKGSHHGELGRILTGFADHVIGFDTYGEQLQGLHINQTLVGLALHGAKTT